MAYLETKAYAAAGAPTGLTAPEAIPVQIRRGETFEQAVRRTGIGADEASAVAATIASAFDLKDMRAGNLLLLRLMTYGVAGLLTLVTAALLLAVGF